MDNLARTCLYSAAELVYLTCSWCTPAAWRRIERHRGLRRHTQPQPVSGRPRRLARHPARPAADHRLLAAQPARRVRQPPARTVGAPARIPRALLHPLPPLLRHPRIQTAAPPRHPDRVDPPAGRAARRAGHHHRRLALRRHRLAHQDQRLNFSISSIKGSPPDCRAVAESQRRRISSSRPCSRKSS
jgi:hypothetical protein